MSDVEAVSPLSLPFVLVRKNSMDVPYGIQDAPVIKHDLTFQMPPGYVALSPHGGRGTVEAKGYPVPVEQLSFPH